MNNSIYQRLSKEPQSMLKATKRLIEILDPKQEKANLKAITKEEFLNHLSGNRKKQVDEASTRI